MDARQVNIYDAKTHLSRLVAEVEAGATVVLARDGRPVCKLVPLEPAPRRFGSAVGEGAWMGTEFDAPLPDDMLADLSP
jgi:antitoxin (DNA-binding transcriptional repressor) of toxin-antitoxin stability system